MNIILKQIKHTPSHSVSQKKQRTKEKVKLPSSIETEFD